MGRQFILSQSNIFGSYKKTAPIFNNNIFYSKMTNNLTVKFVKMQWVFFYMGVNMSTDRLLST